MKNYPYLLGATEQSFINCAIMNKDLFKDQESYQKFEEYINEQIALIKKMEEEYSAKYR